MSVSAPTSPSACAKSVSLHVPGKRRTATFIRWPPRPRTLRSPGWRAARRPSSPPRGARPIRWARQSERRSPCRCARRPRPSRATGARRRSPRPAGRGPRPSAAPGSSRRTPSRRELVEPDGGEVRVEAQDIRDLQVAHHEKAGRVDERIGALIVSAQPADRVLFDVLTDEHDLNSWRALDAAEEVDRRCVTDPPPEKRPGLATDVIRRDERLATVELEKGDRSGVLIISPVAD